MINQRDLLQVLSAHPTLMNITKALLAHGEGGAGAPRCPTCDTPLTVTDLPEVESLYVTCEGGCSNYREHRTQHPHGGVRWVNSFSEANTISCNLSRQTIETKNIAPVLENLQMLLEGAAPVQKFRDSMFVIVDGYNDDPRPLWFIEEVRECLRLLDEQFPYWLHFCEKQTDALRMLVLCLIPLTRTPEGEPATTGSDLQKFVRFHADALRELHRRHNIPQETTRSVLESVSSYFERHLGVRLPLALRGK